MNEKGFMFPVTLCLLLLFSMFLTMHINQYLTEKKMLNEAEEFERNQYYFLQSLYKVEEVLKEEGHDETGTFNYEKGTITYKVTDTGSDLLQISFQLKTDYSEVSGIAYFDQNLQKMVKWVERN